MVDGSRGLLWRVMDAAGIDGIVNGVGKTASGIGDLVRQTQSGFIRSYAAWVVMGSIVVIVAMAIAGGAR